jgi:hypothetical protein
LLKGVGVEPDTVVVAAAAAAAANRCNDDVLEGEHQEENKDGKVDEVHQAYASSSVNAATSTHGGSGGTVGREIERERERERER